MLACLCSGALARLCSLASGALPAERAGRRNAEGGLGLGGTTSATSEADSEQRPSACGGAPWEVVAILLSIIAIAATQDTPADAPRAVPPARHVSPPSQIEGM